MPEPSVDQPDGNPNESAAEKPARGITRWLPSSKSGDRSVSGRFSRPTRGDVSAGMIGAIANVPDGMASSVLAGVNPIYGINTLMVNMPIAALTTSTKLMVVLTTSAMTLTAVDSLGDRTGDERIQALLVMGILAGLFQLALGLLDLGQVTRYVSNAVMTGFLTGVAVLIILGQLEDLTGFDSDYDNKVARAFDLLTHLDEADLRTAIIGVGSLLMMIVLARTRFAKMNLLIPLALATIVVPLLSWDGVTLVESLGEIPRSLPTPEFPALGQVPVMLAGAVAIGVVGLLQAAGISQSYPNPDGSSSDISRDFAAQGAANVAGGFFQAMPGGGSLSSTALNVSAGARSRWAPLIGAVFVVVIVLVLSGLLSRIPMAALAALLVYSAALSIKFAKIATVGQTSQTSTLTMIVTFVATLLVPLQYAVILGVVLAFGIYIYQSGSDIRVREVRIVDGRMIESQPPKDLASNRATLLDIYGSMFFAGAHSLGDRLPDARNATNAVVVLRLRGHDRDIGSTFISMVEGYGGRLTENGGRLLLSGVDPNVRDRMTRMGALNRIGVDNVYLATDVIGESSEQALREAERLVARSVADAERGRFDDAAPVAGDATNDGRLHQ